jgi:hypothetical protein
VNPRQWKKACKKAAAECERRWPGEYVFAPSDGTDTVDAPSSYQPPRHEGRRLRRYAYAPEGTPLLVTKDYWGEVDIETALDTLRHRQLAEDFDWEGEMARLDQESSGTRG